jgi:hypothetical protein
MDGLIEKAVRALPDGLRSVFVLRKRSHKPRSVSSSATHRMSGRIPARDGVLRSPSCTDSCVLAMACLQTNRKRVAAAMARQGLRARPRRRWRRTTDSTHREPIAPNLLNRNFTAEAPDRVWVADTTYLPVLGGFLFLVIILDLFSRKVVGWSIGDRLDAELSGEALRSAIGRRQPRPGLIFHTDRGSEFAAQSFRKLLAQIGAVQSMSRKGIRARKRCCQRTASPPLRTSKKCVPIGGRIEVEVEVSGSKGAFESGS